MEIVFFQSSLDIEVYVPQKKSKGRISKDRYDTVVIKSDKSYADMLRVVRDNKDTERIGLDVRNMRKLKDDWLLIVTQK